ncbi:MAG: hypothetical protein ABR998_10350 [Gemmatimonadales bacterium]|jgi:uncharacterized membrane protein
MKVKTLMLINTVIAGVFGLAFVIVPGWVAANYGITADAAMRFMSQLFGANLVGVAVLCWLAQDVPESDFRSAISWALFVINAVALVVTVVAQLNHVMNAVGWSSVVIFLFFTVGWASFLRAKPAA